MLTFAFRFVEHDTIEDSREIKTPHGEGGWNFLVLLVHKGVYRVMGRVDLGIRGFASGFGLESCAP